MTPRVFIPLGLLVCLLMVGSASAYLTGYGYYQDMTINNTGSNLTNYQMMFVVNTSSGTSSGTTIYLNSHSEADLDDLRFTSTGDTVYDYWIESTSNPFNVWVEVPSILNSTAYGSTTMRVQYGNATATAVSNGTNTFAFFDDFLGSSLDITTKWDKTGTVTVGSGTAAVSNSGGYTNYFSSKSTFSRANTNIHIRAKGSNIGAWWQVGIGYTDTIGQVHPIFAGTYDAKHSLVYDQGGSGQVDVKSTSYSTNTYYRFEFRMAYPYLGWYVDGTEEFSRADWSTTYNTKKIYCGGSTGTTTFDWVFVRQYTATEPTAPAWSGESATTAAPTAAFSGTPTSGATPLTVTFTDASTNTPTSWEWSWDDGTANGTTQNPSHQFTSAGTYTISLTATNDAGSDTETKVDYITVCDTPVAAFSANVTSGTIPLYVAFTDATTGSPASWVWSFDDGGANSTAQNPTRTFSATGTYTITLTATNCGGSDGETKVDYIQAYELTAFPGCAAPPNDLDADGYYEDINGNGRIDWADLIVFFTHLAWAQANQPPALFDFANDGGTITYADVTALYPIVAGGA